MKQAQRREGFVLIVVLVVVVLLSLAAYGFVDRMAAERKAVRLAGIRTQSRLAAESGAEHVARLLGSRAESVDALPLDLFDNPAQFQAVRLTPETDYAEAENRQAPRFTVLAPNFDAESPGPRYGLVDESSKLNLRALVAWDAASPGVGRKALLALPEMSPEIADRILDLVDDDDQPRELGVEIERAGPLTLESLLAIEGVTPELLFGGDLDRNSLADEGPLSSEADSETSAELPVAGWSAWLTLNSAEGPIAPDGSAKIDLNSADLPALHAALVQAFDEASADFVIAYRQFAAAAEPASETRSAEPPRRRTPRLNAQRGARSKRDSGSGEAASRDKKSDPKGKKSPRQRKPKAPSRPAEVDPAAAPPVATLRSPYDLIDAVVEIPASPNRAARTLKSPWTLDNPDAESSFARLVANTATQPGPVIGRVSVVQAPREVLSAVPGLDATAIDALIDFRRAGPAARSDRATLVWLVRERIVTLEQLRRLAPYLTNEGDVFSAQVVGFVDAAGPVERCELVIDATVRPPRQLSWKNLGRLGRGYPPAVLDPLSSPDGLPPPAADTR